jgi:hypothetical protein
VVTTCSEHAEEGHQTCSLKEHRELENFNSEKNKAMFQLKERLARLRTSQPRESIPDASDVIGQDEEVLIDNDGVCDRKPEEGNRTVRARFGRRRTHNEELCVASCGVILGRATFYGSEAPNDIVVSQILLLIFTFTHVYSFSCFGRGFSQPEGLYLQFSGTTTTARSFPCLTIQAVLTTTLNFQHSRLTFFTSNTNTRNQTRSAMMTVIL